MTDFKQHHPRNPRLARLGLGVRARDLGLRAVADLRHLRGTAEGRFPDFLGIGAQKAGTTWLFENLRCHPELFLPAHKELHFFDLHMGRGMRYYRAQFEQAAGRLCGEITPAYGALSERRIRRIQRQNPALKQILILRDPVQRAWSGAVMDLAERMGRATDAVPEAEYETFLLSAASQDRTRYTRMIDRWSGTFSREQLLVCFFEDIHARPEELFREILLHLGVQADIAHEDYPLRRVIVPTLARGGEGTASRQSVERQSPIPPRVRSMLEALYAQEVRELQRRFGAPCEAWSHA